QVHATLQRAGREQRLARLDGRVDPPVDGVVAEDVAVEHGPHVLDTAPREELGRPELLDGEVVDEVAHRPVRVRRGQGPGVVVERSHERVDRTDRVAVGGEDVHANLPGRVLPWLLHGGTPGRSAQVESGRGGAARGPGDGGTAGRTSQTDTTIFTWSSLWSISSR